MNSMHIVTAFALVVAAVGCSAHADDHANDEVASDSAEIVQLGSGASPNVTCDPRQARPCRQEELTCLPTSSAHDVGACCDRDLGECAVVSSAGQPMCLGDGAILGDLRCKSGEMKKKEGALCGADTTGCFDGRCVRPTASTDGSGAGVCCPGGWCASIEGGQGACFGPGASAPHDAALRCSHGAWR